jgi:DNA-binding XRE family transcriptional regulator
VEAEGLRRQIRKVLVAARNKAEMTQTEAAKEAGWSSSKIVRIESGQNPVSVSDARHLMLIYTEAQVKNSDGAVSEDQLDQEAKELTRMAREARDAPSLDQYDDIIDLPLREMMSQEHMAKQILEYEPTFVPGIFQTSQYTEKLLWALGHRGDDLRRRLNARASRERLFDEGTDDTGPEVITVIAEEALRRPVCKEPHIQEDQLQRLINLSSGSDRVSLYMFPLKEGMHEGIGQGFTIQRFEDPELDVVYLDDGAEAVKRNEDPDEVERYIELFNTVRQIADAAEDRGFEEQVADLIAGPDEKA